MLYFFNFADKFFPEEFKQSGKKGFFAMAKTISGKIRDIFQAGMDKLRERFGKKMEARAVWWDNLKSKWQSATQAISDTFKPHLDTLTKVCNIILIFIALSFTLFYIISFKIITSVQIFFSAQQLAKITQNRATNTAD